MREADGLVIRTSGSSGEPLDVLHDRRSALANIAYSERERAVVVAMLGTKAYRTLAFEYSLGTLLVVRAFYDTAAYRPRRPAFAFVPTEEPLERSIEALERIRPDVLIATGSWLEPVFREVLAEKRPIPLPACSCTVDRRCRRTCRELVEDELGIPVVSRYAAAESLKIGYTCEARDGFHLHEDLCVVELIGPDGAPVADGERGSVVVSNLVNLGTVLLRYQLGDHARITSEPCACGRPSRRVVELEGKTRRQRPPARRQGRPLPDAVGRDQARGRRAPAFRSCSASRPASKSGSSRTTARRSTPSSPTSSRGMRSSFRVRIAASWHAELQAEPGRRFETIVVLEEWR